jgi:Carboxypeptidase regulatory-like domain
MPGWAAPCEIGGTVVDSRSGKPLPQAVVSLRYEDRAPSSSPIRSVTAGPDAGFLFAGLGEGRYRVSAGKSGFAAAEFGAAHPGVPGQVIAIGDSSCSQKIQIGLHATGAIVGRVVFEDGQPAVDTPVAAIALATLEMPVDGAVRPTGRTNDLGEFRLFEIPPGRYFVYAGMPRDLHYVGSKQGKSFGLTFSPDVNDPSHASPVEVPTGADSAPVVITLRQREATHVRGRLVGDAVALPHARVMLNSVAGLVAQTPSADDGTLDFESVAPGEYWIAANIQAGGLFYVARKWLVVGNEPGDSVQIPVTKPLDVRGRVHRERSSARTASTLVVTLRPKHGDFQMEALRATVASDGNFLLTNVTPVEYDIVVEGLDPDEYVKSVSAGSREIDSGLDFSSAAPGFVDVILSASAGAAGGTVTDEQGALVRGAFVILIRQSAGKTSESQVLRVTNTDQDGVWRMSGLIPGTYFATASREAASLPPSNPSDKIASEPLAVPATGLAKFDLRLTAQ